MGKLLIVIKRLISTKIRFPLERLRLSVRKKMSSVLTALTIPLKKKCHQFERLGVSVGNKLSSRSIVSGFPFKKIVICSMESSTSMRNNTYLLTLQSNCDKEKRNADATTAD